MKNSKKAAANNLYSESRIAAFLRENFGDIMRWRLHNLFAGVRDEAYRRGWADAQKALMNNQNAAQNAQR